MLKHPLTFVLVTLVRTVVKWAYCSVGGGGGGGGVCYLPSMQIKHQLVWLPMDCRGKVE